MGNLFGKRKGHYRKFDPSIIGQINQNSQSLPPPPPLPKKQCTDCPGANCVKCAFNTVYSNRYVNPTLY